MIGLVLLVLFAAFVVSMPIRLNKFSNAFENVFEKEDLAKDEMVLDVDASFNNLKFYEFWNWDFENMLVYEENTYKKSFDEVDAYMKKMVK